MSTIRHALLLLAVLLLPLAACAPGSEDTADVGTADSGAPPPDGDASPPPDGGEALVMSWNDPFALTLPNGWRVRDCEGDRPHVCVFDGEALLGDIELLSGYPLEAAEDGQEPGTVLRRWAERFVEGFEQDRSQGCPAFTFVADEVTEVTVGGQPGTRTGFTLTDADGRVVERVITHYTLVDGSMSLINTDAYALTDGCLGPAEYDPSFLPEHLAELEAHLDRLVADTPLPDGLP